MTTNGANRPVKEFRVGALTMAVWEKAGAEPNQSRRSYSARFQKRYVDRKTNTWCDTDYLFADDLPRLELLLRKTYEYMLLQESDDEVRRTAAAE